MRSSIYRDLKQMAAECGIKTKGDVMRYGSAALLLILITFIGCAKLNRYVGLPDDHPIEEQIEDHINDTLNVDVDFTPDSKE